MLLNLSSVEILNNDLLVHSWVAHMLRWFC